ncbi:YitT family protein [Hydrogenoanaerobacterium sp.]|uniref:YitT family protein n=1 Tax=Hydrogenoanaerobacterium sp. TaxID=2953763 RepID=UPI002899FF88|nr:YitT family protein [Hydrogenoanaerobacterium sp.]
MKNFTAVQFKVWLTDIIFDIVGASLYAVGVHMFTAPNHIAPGGVTGIATIVNYLWGIPIGTVSLLINIPLLFLSFQLLGKSMTVKTLKSVLVMSLVLDVMGIFLPPYTKNPLLAALFGGVGIGAGLALIFMRGATTGGTDIVARLLQRKFPYLPIGRAMLMVDCVVLITSSFVYQQLESALYGLITIFTCSRVLDSLLYGVDVGKMVLVISEKSEEISKVIIHDLDRGATLLAGKGAYSGNDKYVVLSAVRKNQFHKLKNMVYDVDPRAFIIVAEAGEIMGEGFKPIQSNQK